jgi:ABC-2 type transport system ATP-binding protein
METKPNFKVSEIEEHLDSGNYTLGFRRFLDVCLETDLSVAQKQTVLDLCDTYNQVIDNTDVFESSFLEKVKELSLQFSEMNLDAVNAQNNVVSGQQISKSYQAGHFKLHPISMSIDAGELVGIVGENGNGKTTLLRMMASDLSIDEGEINYELGIGNYESLYDEKSSIAYIPQRIPRWYGKLKNNLHYAASSRGIHGFENEYLVNVMLTRLGLNKYKNLFWTQISSGYRTRFELARILLLKPQLLILDEPLANLDINAQQTFLQDIRNLAKSKRHPMAILFSSQQLHEVEKVADHIVFLRNGESIYNSTIDTNDALETHTETEIETTASRDQILAALNGIEHLSVKQQGGVYIIRCQQTVHSLEILKRIINAELTISYYRDLTHSTKKFFNEN